MEIFTPEMVDDALVASLMDVGGLTLTGAHCELHRMSWADLARLERMRSDMKDYLETVRRSFVLVEEAEREAMYF